MKAYKAFVNAIELSDNEAIMKVGFVTEMMIICRII